MSSMLAIAKRELRAFFTTPIGYIVVGGYALISGLGFTASFLFYARMTQSPSNYGYSAVPNLEESFLSPFLVYCGLLFMFIGPLLTMRLFAEERNQGTIELLFTHPLRDRDIIGGKFLAGLALVGLMVLNLGVYVFLIYRYTGVEVSVLALGLLSVMLMGAAILSVGVFVSSLCSNQITAALLTFSTLFLMFILGYFGGELPEENPAPAAWPEESRAAAGTFYTAFRTIAKQLPVESHAADLAQGIFNPADVVYYVFFVALFLFLTFRALESRRWRV